MSIKAKLAAGFGVLLVILAAMGIVSYFSVHNLSGLSTLADKENTARYVASVIHSEALNQRVQIRSYILTGDEGEIAKAEEAKGRIAENFAKLDEVLTSEEGKRLSADLRNQTDAYYRMVVDVAQLRRAGKAREATDVLFDPKNAALRTSLDRTIADFANVENKEKAEVREEQSAAESGQRCGS